MCRKALQWAVCLLTVQFFLAVAVQAQSAQKGSFISKKTLGAEVSYGVLDINEIAFYIANNGAIGENPENQGNGFIYPAESGHSLIYTAGLQVLGKINGSIRTAACQYATEFQPGSILPDGTADDSALEKYRVYKYGKGDVVDAEAICQGCPEYVIGDQMLFCVFNDLASHDGVFQKEPIGLEVQLTVWGFNRDYALGQTVFVRYLIINKNREGLPLEEAYTGLFLDPDLGQAGDDAGGCRPDLDMMHFYNGNIDDGVYGLAPPALGVAFLQGAGAPGEPRGMNACSFYI